MRKRLWLPRLVGAGAVLAAIGAAAVVPARATTSGLAGYRVVHQTSVTDTADKVVTVTCPAGTKAYSAGGTVDSLPGRVVIERMKVLPDLSGAVVAARTRTTTPAWSVTAYAVCAQGNPMVQQAFGATAFEHKMDSASCEASTGLTGLGGDVITTATTDKPALMRLIPTLSPSVATVWASGPPGSWGVQASAVCASIPDLYIYEVEVGPDVKPQTAVAKCEPGDTLLGGGGDVRNKVNEDGALIELKPNASAPQPSFTASGVGGASPWKMAAYAICAPSS
jgi:hypothetical protein